MDGGREKRICLRIGYMQGNCLPRSCGAFLVKMLLCMLYHAAELLLEPKLRGNFAYHLISLWFVKSDTRIIPNMRLALSRREMCSLKTSRSGRAWMPTNLLASCTMT